ncbi:MAG: hypothetical protein ACO1NM_11610 [Sphingobium phenoxybenzoativorans]
MRNCEDNARPAGRPIQQEAARWTLLSGQRRDLALTLLLGLMRFNPQEAMIVRAGMRHAANSLSAAMARIAGGIAPRGVALPAISHPWAAALCCVALLLPAIRPMMGVA